VIIERRCFMGVARTAQQEWVQRASL
jgi:hypothetical protein